MNKTWWCKAAWLGPSPKDFLALRELVEELGGKAGFQLMPFMGAIIVVNGIEEQVAAALGLLEFI